MNNVLIKVGFCVAYDWELLKKSLPVVYEKSDLICLSLDKNRISWSGKRFDFDSSQFYAFVKQLDVYNKIKIYEDNFYMEGFAPMQNETRQRNLIAEFMGRSGWHIQFDVDEYMIDFSRFVSFLKKNDPNPLFDSRHKITIKCPWIVLFKEVENGFLLVDNDPYSYEYTSVATNYPVYIKARNTEGVVKYSDFFMIHESWARSKEQIMQKIANWGHSTDLASVEKFIDFWDNLGDNNYTSVLNFHPIKPNNWQRLKLIKSKDIYEAIEILRKNSNYKISFLQLFVRNLQIRKRLGFKK